MPSYQTLLVEHAGPVSRVTLNRPPFNLVTPTLVAELSAVLALLENREATRAVILTGAGERAFCAGADLGEEARTDPDAGARFRRTGQALVDRIETFPKPTLAGIRGWCIGGGTALALPCDIRLASDTAKFRTADVYLGIVPSWGMGFVRMVHYIGRQRAMDMLMLGEDVGAQQAYEWGLVSRVVPAAGYDVELSRIGERLAGAAPIAVRALKESIRAQYRDGYDRAKVLEEAWAHEISLTTDAAEGIAAFKEKRKPAFRGA
jgi:enoyl-CoA hydratase/carnithine racemase